MLNKEQKRFCLGVNELSDFIMKDEELKEIFDGFDLEPEEVLELIRNYQGQYVTTNFEVLDTLRDKLSGFLRGDFELFLSGKKESVCAEMQFLIAISPAAKEVYENTGRVPQLYSRWGRWFLDTELLPSVSNEVYETYDFERNENVIMHIVGQLNLPPLQKQYLEHFISQRGGVVNTYNDFEAGLLISAATNVLKQESKICKMLDELLKS